MSLGSDWVTSVLFILAIWRRLLNFTVKSAFQPLNMWPNALLQNSQDFVTFVTRKVHFYPRTGFHWRILLLSRANRLYAIFNTGLKNLGPSYPRYVFVFFTRSKWLWVCLPRAPSNNWPFYFLFPLTGRSPHFRFRVSANHLASPSFPLVSGDLRLLSTNICWYPLCDLHSFLTVTFLTGCHCSFQREDSINLISIVSVGYHMNFFVNR